MEGGTDCCRSCSAARFWKDCCIGEARAEEGEEEEGEKEEEEEDRPPFGGPSAKGLREDNDSIGKKWEKKKEGRTWCNKEEQRRTRRTKKNKEEQEQQRRTKKVIQKDVF